MDVGVGMGGLSSIEEIDSVLVVDMDEVLEARDERFGESNTAPTNGRKEHTVTAAAI